MSAHTPGPWKVINHPRVAHVDSQRSVGFGANGMASIAWLTGGVLNQEANAHLIAAAPDLLAVVEECLESEERRRRELKDGSPASTYSDARLGRIRAAIAKARGGK